jgi:ligand-binding SRPBCC domain-containing protein
LMLRHTSKITQYEPPTFFQDVMTAGMFKSFEHDHRFREQDGETVMRDELRFSAPFGVLGFLVDRIVLRSYLTRFLLERNKLVKQVAESEAWREYLSKIEPLQKYGDTC